MTARLQESFTIDQAANWTYTFTYTDPTTGAAINTTGALANMQVFVLGSTTPTIQFATSERAALTGSGVNGTLALGGVNGQIVVSLTDTQTHGLDPTKTYVYDLFVKPNGGTSEHFAEGEISITPQLSTWP